MKKKNTTLIVFIVLFLLIITALLLNKPKEEEKIEGALKKTTYTEIKQKIKNEDDFILIISRSNCSHCQTYKPKVSQIAKNYNIIVYYIDLDKEEDSDKLLEELNIEAITPTTIFIKEGKETSILNRIEGDVDQNKIIEKFQKMRFIKQ